MTTSRGRNGYGRRQKPVAAAFVVLAGVLGTTGRASAVPVTQTFNFTGGEQAFVVPAGVTSVTVTAVGAPGGHHELDFGEDGGAGRVVTADLPVTPGQTMYIEVGGAGAVFTGGFNGGGTGGGGNTAGGGGGGASDVRTCSATGPCSVGSTLGSRLVVASGGGGGGMEVGGDGDTQGGQQFFDNGGRPGTLSAGGAPGASGLDGLPGLPGEFGTGGTGGWGNTNGPGGGGGGGGYYGGGGGGGGGDSGGGGGGSSFVTGSATNVSYGTDTRPPASRAASVTIGYEDGTPLPTFSISDVTLAEGDAGPTTFTFTITRSGTTAIASSVDWSTADGSAVASSDYTTVGPTTVNFAVGETTKTVEVTVNGDTSIEANDGFTANLSNPVLATIADGTGVGRITNDDAAAFSVDDATVTEGDSGTSLATFTVTRTGDTGDVATVQWRTLDAHAVANGDYVAAPLTTLTFGPGETTRQVSVAVNGDPTFEPTEDFYVRLSNPTGLHTLADATGVGTITNDDAALSISDATLAEGNAGTSLATFTVTRAGDASGTATVQWFTVAGTATAGDDFVAVAPTPLDFAAGETSKTVSVAINGDTAVEANETYSVRLGSPVNASIADGSGLGRITNDDNAAFSVSDATVTEGNAGTTTATFTVARLGAAGGTATVQWSTADGTATATGGDYAAVAPTTLTFAPGEISKQITVTVNGDNTKEANETFQIRLTTPTGAALADSSGLGRITNDD